MDRFKRIMFGLCATLLIFSLCLNVRYCTTRRLEMVRDTTRVTVVDTIRYYKPVPVEEKVIAETVVRLPSARKQKRNTQEQADSAGTDSLPIQKDSADVVMPITRKVYEDNTYRAVVSGYGVNLDTMIVYPRTETLTIENTSRRVRKKRWGIGLSAGYGVTKHGLSPVFAVSVNCNLWQW